MALASNNFSKSAQIREGGYGKVYKGHLPDGTVVAVKRAQEGSLQGEREFITEIELLSRLHHRNLLSLIGYCDQGGEQLSDAIENAGAILIQEVDDGHLKLHGHVKILNLSDPLCIHSVKRPLRPILPWLNGPQLSGKGLIVNATLSFQSSASGNGHINGFTP
ncbi:hypothetical protein JHK82_050643 [Glycine max]|nr:hypothetical protein JHK85_051355 [Glycine max]KAG5091865.1 hypothetical protein JHK82_050643 [Glycine max]